MSGSDENDAVLFGVDLEPALARLRFNDDGLIPAIAQSAADGEVLMLAWMNAAAIRRTLQEGRVVYWSRSRQAFWRKGDTSGHVQRLREMRVDCDRDCLLLIVEQTGAACHTGRRSCFFTQLSESGAAAAEPSARDRMTRSPGRS